MRLSCLIVLLSMHLWAQQPRIVKAVDPDYSAETGAYTPGLVTVKVQIAADGVPLALLQSSAALDDHAAMALSLYQFESTPAGSEATIGMPVRRYKAPAPPKPEPQQAPGVPAPLERGALISSVPPLYPAEAKEKRIQGVVTLQALISKTGEVTNISFVRGPFLLYPSARRAVMQWRYRPYRLKGEAVEVDTQIDVNFKLQ
jgi:protein TonB